VESSPCIKSKNETGEPLGGPPVPYFALDAGASHSSPAPA
jgi:hypothetical protein